MPTLPTIAAPAMRATVPPVDCIGVPRAARIAADVVCVAMPLRVPTLNVGVEAKAGRVPVTTVLTAPELAQVTTPTLPLDMVGRAEL